jgi:hypothetical protein
MAIQFFRCGPNNQSIGIELTVCGETSESKRFIDSASSAKRDAFGFIGCTCWNNCLSEPQSSSFIEPAREVTHLTYFAGKTNFTHDN